MCLGAKLAARSRHVCAFLGAGTARACGLPDVTQLQAQVLAKLDDGERLTFEQQLSGRNLEQALSRLRRIAALLSENQVLDGLTAQAARDLDTKVCQAIVTSLDITPADLGPMKAFAAWAARTDYHSPLEVFTVNYDLLLETAFETWQIPYFDGFVGTIKARFKTELVEPLPGADSMPPFFIRLWKLHGSLNWEWDDEHRIFRCGNSVPKSAAIYPSDTKYDESRRMPFVVLQDRFRRALHQPETLVLVSGYSFKDDHLNEVLFEAATRRERSEIIVFCHSTIPESLAARAAITPNIQVVTGTEAIIGGERSPWEAAEDVPSNIWAEGKFLLSDFKHLSAYLAKSAAKEDEMSIFHKFADALSVSLANGPGSENA
jgi:SIR2-like domain